MEVDPDFGFKARTTSCGALQLATSMKTTSHVVMRMMTILIWLLLLLMLMMIMVMLE